MANYGPFPFLYISKDMRKPVSIVVIVSLQLLFWFLSVSLGGLGIWNTRERPIIPPRAQKGQKPSFWPKKAKIRGTRAKGQKRPKMVGKPPPLERCATKRQLFCTQVHFNQSLIKGGLFGPFARVPLILAFLGQNEGFCPFWALGGIMGLSLSFTYRKIWGNLCRLLLLFRCSFCSGFCLCLWAGWVSETQGKGL